MKIGIYDPYLNGPLGGGERYILTLAEGLVKKGNTVDIFWDEGTIKESALQTLKIDLTKVTFVGNIFSNKSGLLEKYRQTKKYDVIFFLSDGSIPFLFAGKNFIHMQVPLTNINMGVIDKVKLLKINSFVCNSNFTKKTIDRVYGVNSLVLYPPVAVEEFFSNIDKENIILGVGRFTQAQHAKKQHLLIESFRDLIDQGLKGWKLILAGGTLPEDKTYVDKLIISAKGYPIEIKTDIKFSQLKEYYRKAKIFWHAAGYGEDEIKHPERMEHFGIVVVEAMAAGCVPIVINKGGIPEIIENGKNGFLWSELSEMKEITLQIIQSEILREEITKRAIADSRKFGNDQFIKNANAIFKE
jgi:glycosyltransferase involved in cell wall biosynthesis